MSSHRISIRHKRNTLGIGEREREHRPERDMRGVPLPPLAPLLKRRGRSAQFVRLLSLDGDRHYSNCPLPPPSSLS